jgi:hypothetical protein
MVERLRWLVVVYEADRGNSGCLFAHVENVWTQPTNHESMWILSVSHVVVTEVRFCLCAAAVQYCTTPPKATVTQNSHTKPLRKPWPSEQCQARTVPFLRQINS